MPLAATLDRYAVSSIPIEREKGDQIVTHELSRNWTRNEVRKLLLADLEVLPDLNHIQQVFATLSLNRKDVVRTVTVKAHIDLICLDLRFRDGGAQVALQGVGRDA